MGWMLYCAEIFLWYYREVVLVKFRWIDHGGKPNDDIVSNCKFVGYWFRLHGVVVVVSISTD